MKTGKISVEDGIIRIEVINDEGIVMHTYDIPFVECETTPGLCRWIRQIGEKVWTDKDAILRFVDCVLKRYGA